MEMLLQTYASCLGPVRSEKHCNGKVMNVSFVYWPATVSFNEPSLPLHMPCYQHGKALLRSFAHWSMKWSKWPSASFSIPSRSCSQFLCLSFPNLNMPFCKPFLPKHFSFAELLGVTFPVGTLALSLRWDAAFSSCLHIFWNWELW